MAEWNKDELTKITEADLWKRSALSARDRSIVTIAALIARIQAIGMLHLCRLA